MDSLGRLDKYPMKDMKAVVNKLKSYKLDIESLIQTYRLRSTQTIYNDFEKKRSQTICADLERILSELNSELYKYDTFANQNKPIENNMKPITRSVSIINQLSLYIQNNTGELVDFMAEANTGLIKRTNKDIAQLAERYNLTDALIIKEANELSIIQKANFYATYYLHRDKQFQQMVFRNIVDLYNNQATSKERTASSVKYKQYSTPVPIGYLAGMWCKTMTKGCSVFEPSAGNGMLTVAFNQHDVNVNEIDAYRLFMLRLQKFNQVTGYDATEPFPWKNKYNIVITNPPFGSYKSGTKVKFGKYNLQRLDHVCCGRALETMCYDGAAALIIEGHMQFSKDGWLKQDVNVFFFRWLWENYNVADIIPLDGGRLYRKQGTQQDVSLVLINGRRRQPGPLPPSSKTHKQLVEVVKDWNGLLKRLIRSNKSLKSKIKPIADESSN